ncbi:MAG: hypothetical protein R6W68_10140, partial [Ignavibacteriaceae bacterium]
MALACTARGADVDIDALRAAAFDAYAAGGVRAMAAPHLRAIAFDPQYREFLGRALEAHADFGGRDPRRCFDAALAAVAPYIQERFDEAGERPLPPEL